VTAYAPPSADPTDVVGRRILAFVIDLVIMAIAAVAMIVPLFQSTSVTESTEVARCAAFDTSAGNEDSRRAVDSDLCIEINDEVVYIPAGDERTFTQQVYGIGFGLQALNLILIQGLVGASIGKMVVGLRVIREDGTKAGLGWALLRYVVLLIDSFCCFLPGLALVFSTKGHRRLGDMLASTFVVRSSQVGTPPQVPGVTAPVGSGLVAGGWPGAPVAPGAPGWPAAPTTAPSADAPTWDDARSTYIQYDRDRGEWMEWDAGTGQWIPISQ